MKIRVFGQSGELEFPWGESGPWLAFRDTLIKHGHEIVQGDLNQPADCVIAHSWNTDISNYLKMHRVPFEMRVFVMWEPFVVDPIRYRNEVLNEFGHRFAPSIEWAKRINAQHFRWPQDPLQAADAEVFENWPSRVKKAVVIQGNKFSVVKGEMYSLRRKAIKTLFNQIDLYGTNWNRGFGFDLVQVLRSCINSRKLTPVPSRLTPMGYSYPNYRGVSNNKLETLQNYQVALVIENSSDFVSEKLFDALNAGCFTIYAGANLAKFGLPCESTLAVNPNIENIANAVNSVLNENNAYVREAAEKQRASMEAFWHSWENRVVLPNLANSILEALKGINPVN